jgi:chromosome segregation ATPase
MNSAQIAQSFHQSHRGVIESYASALKRLNVQINSNKQNIADYEQSLSNNIDKLSSLTQTIFSKIQDIHLRIKTASASTEMNLKLRKKVNVLINQKRYLVNGLRKSIQVVNAYITRIKENIPSSNVNDKIKLLIQKLNGMTTSSTAQISTTPSVSTTTSSSSDTLTTSSGQPSELFDDLKTPTATPAPELSEKPKSIMSRIFGLGGKRTRTRGRKSKGSKSRKGGRRRKYTSKRRVNL